VKRYLLADEGPGCNRNAVAFAEHASPPTRTMAAAQSLLQVGANTRVAQLARESCMSIRNYERRFVGEMGIPPKLFARVGRFQMALDRKRALGTRSR
jgi:hypothetical protein